MVDDAVILAAGLGTRAFPGNYYCPKEFTPFMGVPLMHHLIWEATTAGVRNIHLVISPEKVFFANLLKTGRADLEEKREDLESFHFQPVPKGVKLNIHIQEDPLGVGDAISIAARHVSGPFLLLLGDNAIMEKKGIGVFGPHSGSSACKLIVERFEESGRACLGAIKVDPEKVSKYGIVEEEDGLLTRIIEKPRVDEAMSDLAICGRYLLPIESADILEQLRDESRLEVLSIDMLERISEDSGIEVVDLSGMEWVDAGDMDSLLRSQIRMFKIQ